LSVPLLILAWKLPHHVPKGWSLVIFYAALLGCAVAAAEHRRRRIPVWTVVLEFFFVWFLIYALFEINFGHIRSRVSHVAPWLAILAGVGAIFSFVMCLRALVKSTGKIRSVHPILPALLICMTVGLGAAAIGSAGNRYTNIQTLHNIGQSSYDIAKVFLWIALLVNLLAPLLALVRRLQGTPNVGQSSDHGAVSGPTATSEAGPRPPR
jgi:hypothetical protein